MNNFKQPSGKNRPRTVDGIVGGYSQSPGTIDFRRPAGYKPQMAPRLDDFRRPGTAPFTRRPEGFQPGQRQQIAPGATAFPRATVESVLQLDERPKVKKSRHRARNARKVLVRGMMTMVLLSLVGGGYLSGKAYLKAKQVFRGGAEGAAALQENVDPSQLRGEGDGRVNIMVLGKGGPGHEGADLTDTLLIASIDPLQKEASLLSIPRDMYVKVTGLGSMKVNSVYANAKQRALSSGKRSNDQLRKAENAGIEAIQKALEQSMGIPIHYYGMVDFEAFRKAIDTVGGITIDVKEPLYDTHVAWENNNSPLIAAKGVQVFNGKKALLYARSRYGSARGDFDRAQRQREVILALKDKVLSIGTFGNPLKIAQLMEAFGDHAQTNLSRDEVMRLYNLGKDIPSNKIASIGLSDPPNNFVTTDFIDGQSVVVPRAGVNNFKEIQNFVRNSLKDGFIRNENASIVILNGTSTAGLATRRSEELKSFGYNVIKVGDTPTKNYSHTILVDMRGGIKKYTRKYLESRLGVTAVNNLPDSAIQPGEADFIIILGRNEATTSSQN